MWIVKLALRRPYTFVVMALLILLLGISAIKTTPTDPSGSLRDGVEVKVQTSPSKNFDQQANAKPTEKKS